MAKKLSEHEARAAAVAAGLDATKLDWTKLLAILQTILSLFQQPQPAPAMTAKAGCEDDHAACQKVACLCGEAFYAALEMLEEHCEIA